tara:strand:+ start:1172 stop:1429 length:258 start_codon:yes stop_codon:yes gene_type:complete
MTRFHATVEGNIPFTSEEETEWDAMAAQHKTNQLEVSKTQYQRDRAAEYPSITDYLDGIVKGDHVQVQAYIDACLAVKAKYPKGV